MNSSDHSHYSFYTPLSCEAWQSEGLKLSILSPLDQFEIRDLLSLDAPILANLHLSITNIGLYLTITAAICLALAFLATNYNKVTANN